MRTGWIARIENPLPQDRIFTLIACSRTSALARCAELRAQHENIKIELIGPYSEVLETQREVKTIESQDLASLFKQFADFNPLLISREEQNFKIELDKVQ